MTGVAAVGTVAIIAPGGRDASVIDGILGSAKIARSIETVPSLLTGVGEAGFAAALVAEEALAGVPAGAVAAAVASQPPWSDFPFIVLTRRGRAAPSDPVLHAMQNVTEIERPVHPATLLGTVRSALRARVRQRETAMHLSARQAAEAELRLLAQTLEARVGERTKALSATNARLQREIAERTEAEARVAAMQDQLIHVSRLSAMGTMGATIAHELNQPLAAIVNYMRGAERLVARLDGAQPELLAAIDAVAANAHRAGTIIRSLRNLVQQRAVERRPESTCALFEEAQVLGLIDGAARGVTCRIEIDPRAEQIMVDRVQIQQVLINLIRNAVEALDGLDRREIVMAATPGADQRILVSVSDSGPGFPPDALTAGLTSWKTSKPTGLGIGLSICRTILEDYGASFLLANRAEGGAEIQFDLPAA
mgnify:CR=1 FL=1